MADFCTRSPFRGDVIQEYNYMSEDQWQRTLLKAHRAYEGWSSLALRERIQKLELVSAQLLHEQSDLAEKIHIEMGKPMEQALAEIAKCQTMILEMCEMAKTELSDESLQLKQASKGIIQKKPLGVIFGIMPWNFPIWQVLRFAIPNLLLGNTILVKTAENTQGCLDKLAGVFAAVDFPADVVSVVRVSPDQSERIIAHKWVRGVAFTGSEGVGRLVGECAGRHLKKSVLELGGSDPYIVFEDAHIASAAKECVKSRLLNSGQVCIAAKRWIVSEDVYESFLNQVKLELKNYRASSDASQCVNMGPLARKDLAVKLCEQVEEAMGQGAQLLLGSLPSRKAIESGDLAVQPVVLLVNSEMPIGKQEVFGPVALVFIFSSEVEALELANGTSFGLGASLFLDASNEDKVKERIDAIEAGSVFINKSVQTLSVMPFGGVKNSGYGRELSKYSFLEFCNLKSIVV